LREKGSPPPPLQKRKRSEMLEIHPPCGLFLVHCPFVSSRLTEDQIDRKTNNYNEEEIQMLLQRFYNAPVVLYLIVSHPIVKLI